MKIFSMAVVLLILQGCDAGSETTCENPNSNDPVCTLDSRRLIGQNPGEGDVVQACTAAREGLISFDAATQIFQVCTGGRNQPISVAGQGPSGPQGPEGSQGPQGPTGPAGGTSEAVYQTSSQVLLPGESLTITHNLNSTTAPVFAYFARGGVLRPISDYKNAVGRKTLSITGGSWNQTLAPEIFTFANGNIGVIRENVAEVGVRTSVLDIWSDEGELVKLGAQVFASMSTMRAINVSNGVLLVYENAGGTDEFFTVLDNNGATIVGPVVIGPSPATNRVKDIKLLSDGSVVVSQQIGGNAAFHILNPLTGAVIATNNNVAASSDYRTIALPVNGQFHLYFSDLTPTENSRIATFANDGTLIAGPQSSGFGDETVFGANRYDNDRVAVVTSYVSNVSSRVLDFSLNQIRAKVIHSALSVDGVSPLPLGNGRWVVCSSRSEGYCIAYDRDGQGLFRNGDLFTTQTAGDFASMTALGNSGRFAIATRNTAFDAGYINILQAAPGRLDLEVVDTNSVRVVNRTVESLPVVLTVLK